MTFAVGRWLAKSIMGRLLLASLVLLPMLVGLTGFGLDRAFKNSLLAAERGRLTSQVYLLLAAADVNEGELELPKAFTEPLLSQANSGLYGFVHADKGNRLDSERELWRSTSAQWLLAAELGLHQSPTLKNTVTEFGSWQSEYFYLRYRVRWEFGENNELPLVFSVYQSTAPFNAQLQSYRASLWRWLLLVATGTLFLQAVLLFWGLRPLRDVTAAIAALNRGERRQIDGQFPLELQSLADNINELLIAEKNTRERYRNTLADLAHSIKTPLAVARNELHTERPNVPLLTEQLVRMHDIVSHQLQRARVSDGGFQLAVDAKPVVQRLCNTLQKLHPSVQFEIPEQPIVLRMDEKDLFEILGNVLENACKYGATRVQVTAEPLLLKGLPHNKVTVADDGPGVEPSARASLVQRGKRLDEHQSGQGLGLALVQDILVAYEGALQLHKSELGGLAVQMFIPDKKHQ